MILFQLIILAIVLWIAYKFIASTTKTTHMNGAQFITAAPVLSALPKNTVSNTHWFTHTFMRPRRKG